MTPQQQKLSSAQQELVAVGASVGAGCQPCVSHHLEAGASAGLNDKQLLAAVTSAERVNAEAAVAIGDHARGKLGPEVTLPALLARLEEALASLGAALAANDLTNIKRQLRAAAELGASRSQLQQAIETAHSVQENAARIHLREAERLLDTVAPATAAGPEADSSEGCGCGTDAEPEKAPPAPEAPNPAAATSGSESGAGCGCGTDSETDKASRETGVPELTVATSVHSGGCSESMAGRFGAGGAAGAMADCREMFERFMPAATPAETDKAPAATVAAGSCKKEV